MLMNALLLALREIRRNLMRSFLTILGIVIGVAAVITMVTLGNGATRMVAEQISSLGSNLLIMRPGQRLGPGRDEAGAPKFRVADAEAIKSQVSALQAVAPVVGSSVTLVAGNENWSSTVSGTTNAYFITGNWKLAAGRQFSDEDEKVGRAVCVIGNTVRDKLFGHQNPLGAELRIKNFSCEIIGLLASKGQGAMGMDQDDVVVIPLLTAQRRLTGNQDVATLMISMQDGADTSRVMAQIRQLMRERRKLAENDDDNFNLMDTKQIAQALSGTIGTMTALLGAVAAVSLLVGGIGIMNIMLVSVTERTREIGVRKAVGAKRRDIMLQFLIEAALLAVLGGAVGIVIGFIAGAALGKALLGTAGSIPLWAVLAAFGVPALIGVIFGLYPAAKASKLDPIEALRFE